MNTAVGKYKALQNTASSCAIASKVTRVPGACSTEPVEPEGHLTVILDWPDTGGLYRFSDITYRGVQIGDVTAVGPTASGEKPHWRSTPRRRSPPTCTPRCAACRRWANNTSIWFRVRSIPWPVGTRLDKLSALVKSIPKDKLGQLLG